MPNDYQTKLLELIGLYDELVGIQSSLLLPNKEKSLINLLRRERKEVSQHIEVLRDKLLPLNYWLFNAEIKFSVPPYKQNLYQNDIEGTKLLNRNLTKNYEF